MYNLVPKHFDGDDTFGFDVIYSLNELKSKVDFYSFENPKKALSKCKSNSLIYIVTYQLSIELFSKIKDKNSIVFINLYDLIKQKGYYRAVQIRRMSQFLKFIIKYNIPYVLSFYIDDDFELRNKKECIALASLLDLTYPQIKSGFELLGEIME